MNPSKNIALGLFLTLAGLSLLVYGMYVGYKSISDRTTTLAMQVTMAPVTKEQCLDALRRNRFSVTEVGVALHAEHLGLDEPRQTLDLASISILQCPGYQLTSFCMGSPSTDAKHPGCKVKGVAFTLSPAK
jgi:hypothetical protein